MRRVVAPRAVFITGGAANQNANANGIYLAGARAGSGVIG